jgi:hypothetical protein
VAVVRGPMYSERITLGLLFIIRIELQVTREKVIGAKVRTFLNL